VKPIRMQIMFGTVQRPLMLGTQYPGGRHDGSEMSRTKRCGPTIETICLINAYAQSKVF
jgi:hypothetical protein